MPQCGTCGRAVPKGMYRQVLPKTGTLVCGRCIDAGVLSARLACGCIGVPGMTVTEADMPSHSRCERHAGELVRQAGILGEEGNNG